MAVIINLNKEVFIVASLELRCIIIHSGPKNPDYFAISKKKLPLIDNLG